MRPMLKKILGLVGCLVLAGMGVALIAGWLDPNELDTDSGRGRSRALKSFIQWLTEAIGVTGTGALLVVAGLGIAFFTLRSGGDAPKAPAKK